ncbi:MAG TPA: glucose-6-phosphate dehydrogenase [Candidatus Norongarragalinales archaeon]|nr:glucose-6-phosphate dehydrogenase [Candidatus Norongarragalinales archaeon]
MASNTLVIFGASGDLTHRKLLPALWKGHLHGRLPDLDILGVARRPWTDEIFRKSAKNACEPKDLSKWASFEERVTYVSADVSDSGSFGHLCHLLDKNENLLFFLATSPELFEPISTRLVGVKNSGFKRLMIEKPFGTDLKSARRLHAAVHKAFGDNVYAVDHYLGKNVVRNLLALRFSNRIFEGVWNKKFIERIDIHHAEELGVGHRAAYYDGEGALNDMVQSHLLQILARVAMEKPRKWTSEEVAREKANVLKKLKPEGTPVFGQYEGYVEEVGHKTHTETFCALKLSIDNPRFRGVPVFITTGKRLGSSFAKVVVTFKPTDFMGSNPATTLTVQLQPEEHFTLTVNLRRPGQAIIEPFKMDYCSSCEFDPHAPEAYEALFDDALKGKKSFFAWWPEIEASWMFVEKVRKRAGGRVFPYAPGTVGPVQAKKWIQ